VTDVDGTGVRGSWNDPARVEEYLARIGRSEPRAAGEAVLAEVLPSGPQRVLDLGCGDGRLAALVLAARPDLREVVALDVSPPMLAKARERFADDRRVIVVEHDLADPLPVTGPFDVVVSGFAIHHLVDERKRSLYAEIAQLLDGDGLFANLEVVASPTEGLHRAFRRAIGRIDDDPEDRLVAVETQLGWLREVGLDHVDCLWRWRGFALLVGVTAGSPAPGERPGPVPAPAPPLPAASAAPGGPAPVPPAAPPPGALAAITPPPGAPGPDAMPARDLAGALAGIALPAGLAPLTHAALPRPGAIDSLTLMTDVDAFTVTHALAAELARLGYTTTWDGPARAVATRGATVVRFVVEGPAAGAAAPEPVQPLTRRQLKKAGPTGRPGFGTAPPGATVVQLWL
jgi:tRNA (cmo5U34)-methyltransferase